MTLPSPLGFFGSDSLPEADFSVEETLQFLEDIDITQESRVVDKDATELFTIAETLVRNINATLSEALQFLEDVDITTISRVVDKDATELFTISETINTVIKRLSVEETLQFLEDIDISKTSRTVEKDATELFTIAEAISQKHRVSVEEALLFLEVVDITTSSRDIQKDATELFTISETGSIVKSSVVPADPTGLTATGTINNDFVLEWTDNADNETNYEVERSTDGISFSHFEDAGSFSGTGTVQHTTGTMPDGTYYWRVRACNANGCSGYSNIDSDTI